MSPIALGMGLPSFHREWLRLISKVSILGFMTKKDFQNFVISRVGVVEVIGHQCPFIAFAWILGIHIPDTTYPHPGYLVSMSFRHITLLGHGYLVSVSKGHTPLQPLLVTCHKSGFATLAALVTVDESRDTLTLWSGMS